MRKQILFYLDDKVIKQCNCENGFCSIGDYDDIPKVGKQLVIGNRIYRIKEISVGKSIYVSLKADMEQMGKIVCNVKAEKKRRYFD